MTPGPIAVNSATFVGLKVAGIGGAAIATADVSFRHAFQLHFLQSFIFVTEKWICYREYQECFVRQLLHLQLQQVFLILVTAFWPEGMILIQKTQIDMVIIFIAAVYLIQFRKMNPVLVMVLSGVAKLGIYLVGTFLL